MFGISAGHLSNYFISNSENSLVKFFAIFALGVLAKPIGSMFFGFIGDTKGRTVSIKLSAFILTLSSLIICVVPSVEIIGQWSAMALMISRILLIIAIGGESDGVKIYITDIYSKNNQYLAIGLVIASTQVGVLLAFFISYLIELLNLHFKVSFIIGSILGIIVLALRSYFIECADFFKDHKREKVNVRYILEKIRAHKIQFVLSIFMFGSMGGIYQFYVIFLKSYQPVVSLLGMHNISKINMIGVAFFGLVSVISGYVADMFKFPKIQIYFGLISAIVLSCMNALMLYNNEPSQYVLVLSIAVIPIYMVAIELYIRVNTPKEVLYTLYSTAHSIGSVILSSTTPLICSVMWQRTKIAYAPYLYLLLLISSLTLCIKFARIYEKEI